MTPTANRRSVPRFVILTWMVSIVLGGAVVGTAAAQPEGQARSLNPRTLSGYLAQVVPVGAKEIRVNGVYGSGHSGAWQFVAHLTWNNAGTLAAGVTNLPVMAGTQPIKSALDAAKLLSEHEMGWTIAELDRVLSRLEKTDQDRMLVELEVTTSRDSVVACGAADNPERGRCTEHDRAGRKLRSFPATLRDEPAAGALSVRQT